MRIWSADGDHYFTIVSGSQSWTFTFTIPQRSMFHTTVFASFPPWSSGAINIGCHKKRSKALPQRRYLFILLFQCLQCHYFLLLSNGALFLLNALSILPHRYFWRASTPGRAHFYARWIGLCTGFDTFQSAIVVHATPLTIYVFGTFTGLNTEPIRVENGGFAGALTSWDTLHGTNRKRLVASGGASRTTLVPYFAVGTCGGWSGVYCQVGSNGEEEKKKEHNIRAAVAVTSTR